MEEQQYEPIFPERTVIYGSFWERFGASILDGLILMIPNFIVTYLVTGNIVGSSLAASGVNVLTNWLYAALQESGAAQATLGKRALGLRVTTLDGNRVSFGQATGRYFGKFLSTLIIFIGYLMMIWDDKKQTLHDKMAGTLVVKSK